MASGFKLEIKGLDKLQKKIDKLPKDLVDETDGYVENICKKIQENAQNKAPNDKGALRQSIEVTGARLSYRIHARAHYAPYVEFGTGTNLGIPSRLSDYARQFKGGNKRQQFMAAQPFFFQFAFKAEEKFKAEYSKLLDKVLSK